MPSLGTIVPESPLNISDDSRHTFADKTSEVVAFALGNMPSDFGTMDDLSWDVEWGSIKTGADGLQLNIRIVDSSFTTVLAGLSSDISQAASMQSVVFTNSASNEADSNVGVTAFTFTNTSANKAAWDGALLQLEQDFQQDKSPDTTCQLRVDHVPLTGNYTIAGAGVNIPVITYQYRQRHN